MKNTYALALPTALLLAISASAQGDTCTTAQVITGTGTYLANGPASGYAGPACGGGNNGDWYSYTPTFTGAVEISSCDPNNISDDTYLKVFTGSCGALTCMGYNDDILGGCAYYMFSSELQFNVVAGQTYYIVWTDMFDSDAFYWHLGECYGSVRGVTYRDQDSDGVRDTVELLQPVMLAVNPGATNHWSAGDPYTFCTDSGTYTITVPNPPAYHTTVPASHTYTVSTQGALVTGMDFAFQPIPGIYDGSINLWGWNPWIGNNTTLNVTYCNIGTEIFSGTVGVTLDPALSYVTSATTPDSVVGQAVYWSFANMMPGACANINFTIHTDSTTAPGDTIVSCADLDIDHLDINMADNTDCLTGHATTSFDPNEKLVDVAEVSETEVADQRKLEYTIHFQNTGTAPAVNIIVRDTVDADLDLSTFEMVGSTHPCVTTVANNVITWNFSGIMLPDSTTDEPNSHGGIHFKMAPKLGSIPGTEFTNRADIYFDFNAPVLTNTTSTIVALGTGLEGFSIPAGLLVYPSPGDGRLTVANRAVDLHGAQLTVRDVTGRTVYMRNGVTLSHDQVMTLDLTSLANGTYVLRATANGTEQRTTFTIRH